MGKRLRVEFSGVYEYRSPQGPMANTGEGSRIAHIEGDTVIFKPEVSEDECAITMKYLGGRFWLPQRPTGPLCLEWRRALGAMRPVITPTWLQAKADPLSDIDVVINHVKWVMKGGSVVVDKSK